LHALLLNFWGSILVALIVAGAVLPAVIFKDLRLFAIFVVLFLALALTPTAITHRLKHDRSTLFSALLVGWGIVVLILSFLHFYDDIPLLDLRPDYILRHGYFVFLWLPFLFGAANFWAGNLGWIVFVCERWGFAILCFLAGADLITAHFFADPKQLAWVGYRSYMEKSTFAFLFVTIYLTYLLRRRRHMLCGAFLCGYFLLTKILQLGIMFNAMTGTIMFLFLATATVGFFSFVARARLIAIGYALLLSLLVGSMVNPGIVKGDTNAYWRAIAWQTNLQSLWSTGLVGVGFGTPYLPLTSLNFVQATMNLFDSQTVQAGDAVEAQYFRGQHSSLVNIAYRLGVPGIFLFVFVNIYILSRLYRLLSSRTPERPLMFLAFVQLIVMLTQISVHVGLESPRFFMMYILATGLALMSSHIGLMRQEEAVCSAPVSTSAPSSQALSLK
jgi:hypothetical protein